MISKILEKRYGATPTEGRKLTESTNDKSPYKGLTWDILIAATEQLIGEHNLDDAFIIRSIDSKTLIKAPAMLEVDRIIKDFAANTDTGEILSPKRCVERIAKVVLEVRLGLKSPNWFNAEEEKWLRVGRNFGVYDFEYQMPSLYNSRIKGVVTELEEMIIEVKKQLKEKDQEILDTQSVASIKAEVQDLLKDEDICRWLCASITNISAVYPEIALDTYIEIWEPELKEAGITSDKVKETEYARWGFSIEAKVSDLALNKLKAEALTNAAAKKVLEKITDATTIKKIHKVWKETNVLTDNNRLSGNYWVIALVKGLNAFADKKGYFPFDLGDNDNRDIDFTFIE